ncbi:MAG: ABC transporter substrate-binding protein [Desulfococcaceae bacterium]|nr:ABC transporter substrate-binding protein [Desulfococcaceae bacterium]
MNTMSRRDFLKTAAAVGAGSVTGPLFSPKARAEEAETVRIGYLPITDATPLLIAHARGYFADEGLKAEKPVRIRDWSTLSESFLSGKFNLVHLLLPIPIWMRYHLKVPAKIMAWDHTNGSAVTVGGQSDISGFPDLGGKQIAVPYWYSMHNVILQLGLRKAGLKPVIRPQDAALKSHEVNLFVLPPPEMPVALSAGKIDGFIVAEPFNAFAELRIKAKIMRFTGDIWKNHPCCVVVMNENLIRAKPLFTQKVLHAVVRAQLWIKDNPEKTAKILSHKSNNYLPAPENVLQRVFSGYANLPQYGKGNIPRAIQHPEWNTDRISFQPWPYPSATRFILQELRQTLVEGDTDFIRKISPDYVVKDLVDYQFVKKAIMYVGGPGKFEMIDPAQPWDREEIVAL